MMIGVAGPRDGFTDNRIPDGWTPLETKLSHQQAGMNERICRPSRQSLAVRGAFGSKNGRGGTLPPRRVVEHLSNDGWILYDSASSKCKFFLLFSSLFYWPSM